MKQSPIQAIRDFNRFYTNVIGLVDNHILNSSFSLPEARVIFELAHTPSCSAKDILENLSMDKGYLSRMLEQFKRKGLVTRKASQADGRASLIMLTEKGKSEFEKLDQASGHQIKLLLKNISPEEQSDLLHHMTAIKKILRTTLS